MKNRNCTYFLLLLLFIGLLPKLSYSKEQNFFDLKIPERISFIITKNNTIEQSVEFKFEKKFRYFKQKTPTDSIKSQKEAKSAKKPFFGKIYSYGLPPAPGIGPCEVGVFKTFYFFGIKIYGPKPVMIPLKKNESILVQEVVPCGTEYPPVSSQEDEKHQKNDKNQKPERKIEF